MFRDIGAPIQKQRLKKLFNEREIEELFYCEELAFNFSILKEKLFHQLVKADIDVRLSTELTDINQNNSDEINVKLSNGSFLQADYVFNVTYSHINKIIDKFGCKRASIKHEIAEMTLVKLPLAFLR